MSIVITKQPEDIVGNIGGTAVFAVEAEGDGLTYQWQYSSSGGENWANLTWDGATTATMTGKITATRAAYVYRCLITDANGIQLATRTARMTIPVLTITRQPADITVPVDNTATFSIEAEGQDIAYQWQYSTDSGAIWHNSSTGNPTTAVLSVVAEQRRNGYMYRCVITAADGESVTSDAATLLVLTRVSNWRATSNGTTITVAWDAALNAVSYYVYRSLTMDGGYGQPVETTELMYADEGLEAGTTYYYKIRGRAADGTLSQYSGAAYATATNIYIVRQPESITTALNATATFTVDATGNGLTYQWQYQTPSETVWLNSTAEGYDTPSYSLQAYDYRNGQKYRCVITDEDGQTLTSAVAMLTVAELTIIKQPESISVKTGDTVTFTVEAEGDGLTYQWEYSTNGGEKWDNNTQSGNTTDTLTFVMREYHNGYIYRCKITDSAGAAVRTNEATLTLADETSDEINITKQPENVIVKADSTATFTVEAEGEGLTYQWEYSTDGGEKWNNNTLNGNATNTLSFTAKNYHNGYLYRCKVTDPNGKYVRTNEVTLTIAAISITNQPENTVALVGDTVTFTVEAEGHDVAYQWQYNPGNKWYDLTDWETADTASLTFATTATRMTWQYRCRLTDPYGNSVTTNAVVIGLPVSITVQPEDVNAGAGETAVFTVEAEGDVVGYRWEVNTGDGWTASDAEGSDTASMSVSVMPGYDGYRYRCVITGKGGDTAVSDEALLTVLLEVTAYIDTPQIILPDAWQGRRITLSMYVKSDSWAGVGGITVDVCAGTEAAGRRVSFTERLVGTAGALEAETDTGAETAEDGKWLRIWRVFELTEAAFVNAEVAGATAAGNTRLQFRVSKRGGGTVQIKKLKAEWGNVATDWSPAPEDVDGEFVKTQASIELIKNEIEMKVSQETLDERIESVIEMLPDEITLAVSGMKLGGRNYLRNSAAGASGTAAPLAEYAFGNEAPEEGDDIAVQIWGEAAGNGYFRLFNSGSKVFIGNAEKADDGVYRFKGKWTLAAQSGNAADNVAISTSLRVYGYPAGSQARIYKIKLENSDKFSDWSPAPEDVDADIAGLEGRVSAAELKITDDSIVSTVTSSEVYKGDVSGLRRDIAGNAQDIDALVTRVSAAELKITDDSIVSTVTSSTEYRELQNDISSNAQDLAGYITANDAELRNLQSQIDGSITTWFYDVAPTNVNEPAVNWATTDDKNLHLGDLYYDTVTGYCYRWQVANNAYSWQRITDTDVTKALSDAAAAQDTADKKRRVFVVQPVPPYDAGDIWTQGDAGDIMVCQTAKAAGQSYAASDWKKASKYTDDTTANANAAVIATHTTQIQQLDSSIKLAATKTEVNTLSGRVDTAEAKIDLIPDKIELAVSSMTMGVRNYLKDSGITHSATNATASGDIAQYSFGSETPQVGKTYTIRIWGSTGSSSVTFSPLVWGDKGDGYMGYWFGGSGTKLADGSYVYTDTWTVSSVGVLGIRVSGSTSSVRIDKIMLSEGSTVSDWTPHWEEFRSGSSIELTEEKVNINTPEFNVNILGDDGETNMLSIDEKGAQMSSLVAPNVARQYDGPAVLYVNPSATSAQVAGGNYFRSLAAALEIINNRILQYEITINLQAGALIYGDATVKGVYGAHWLRIVGNASSRPTLVGALNIHYNGSPVSVSNVKIQSAGTGLYIVNSYAMVDGCIFQGSGGSYTYGIYSVAGANPYVRGCEFYDFGFSLYAETGGTISAANCKGNCSVYTLMSALYLFGTMPCASTTWTYYSDGGNVCCGNVTVNQGSKPTAVAQPTAVTAAASTTRSYSTAWRSSDYDIRQGYYKGLGEWAGCFWFPTSGFSGKTIKSATLTLTRIRGTGRSDSVALHLYGIKISGASGNPHTSKVDYGVLGDIANGETKLFTLPLAAAQALASGTIKGFMLYSNDGGVMSGRDYGAGYCRISPSGGTAPLLTVNY